jgi:hypothetical protein
LPDREELGFDPPEREPPDRAAPGFEPPDRDPLGRDAVGLDPPEREPPDRAAPGFEPPDRDGDERAPLVPGRFRVVGRGVADVDRGVAAREGVARCREEPDRSGLRLAPAALDGDSVRWRVLGGLDIRRYRSRTRSALSPAAPWRGAMRWGVSDCRLGAPDRRVPPARAGSREALVRRPSSVVAGAPRIRSDDPGEAYWRGRPVWPRNSSAALRADD